jgi:excisionase family DNA binding protein
MEAIRSERLLDVEMAAKRLHVSPATIRRRIQDRQLRAFRVGEAGGLRIRAKDVERSACPLRRRKEGAGVSKIAEFFIRPDPFEPDPAEFGEPEEKPRHWRIQLVEDTHAAAKARDVGSPRITSSPRSEGQAAL